MSNTSQKPEIHVERIVSEIENGYLRAHQEKRRWRVFVLYGTWRVTSEKPIELSHLQAAWAQVLELHPNLLATYHLQQNGEWKAYIRRRNLSSYVIHLEDVESALRRLKSELESVYHHVDGCLFRLILSRDPKTGQQLIFYIIHHLISDAVSNILIKNTLSNALEERLGITPTLTQIVPVNTPTMSNNSTSSKKKKNKSQSKQNANSAKTNNNHAQTSQTPTHNNNNTLVANVNPNSPFAEVTSYEAYANVYHKWLTQDRLKDRTYSNPILPGDLFAFKSPTGQTNSTEEERNELYKLDEKHARLFQLAETHYKVPKFTLLLLAFLRATIELDTVEAAQPVQPPPSQPPSNPALSAPPNPAQSEPLQLHQVIATPRVHTRTHGALALTLHGRNMPRDGELFHNVQLWQTVGSFAWTIFKRFNVPTNQSVREQLHAIQVVANELKHQGLELNQELHETWERIGSSGAGYFDFNFLTFLKEDRSQLLTLSLDENDEYAQMNTCETRKLPPPLLDFQPSPRVKFLYYNEQDCARFQYWPQYHSRETITEFFELLLSKIEELYPEDSLKSAKL